MILIFLLARRPRVSVMLITVFLLSAMLHAPAKGGGLVRADIAGTTLKQG
jgi:hypothetical protein